MARIISFSGTHGTGKTTSALKYAVDLKYYKHNRNKSVHALCDLEAACPYPINKQATEETQLWLFSNHIKQEMDALQNFDVVVTDRTIIDVIAYTYVAGFQELAQGMLSFAEHHMQYYRPIHFKKIENNQHCYDDGIRDAEDLEYRQNVESTMLNLYLKLDDADMLPGGICYA